MEQIKYFRVCFSYIPKGCDSQHILQHRLVISEKDAQTALFNLGAGLRLMQDEEEIRCIEERREFSPILHKRNDLTVRYFDEITKEEAQDFLKSASNKTPFVDESELMAIFIKQFYGTNNK